MDQKFKIAIIGLVVIIILLGAGLSINLSLKQALQKENDKLASEKESLISTMNTMKQDNQNLKSRLDAVNADLDRMTAERTDLQRKIEASDSEKRDLAEQIKNLKSQRVSAPAPAAPTIQPTFGASSQAEDAYWAGILKAKTDMEFQLESLRNELRTAKINSEQFARDKGVLEIEVTNLNRDKQELMRKLDYNQKMMDSVAQELVREKNDKIGTEETIKAIKSENAVLRRQMTSLNSRKIDLDKQIAGLQAKNTNLEGTYGEMDVALKEKMLELEKLKKEMYVSALKSQNMSTPEDVSKEDAVELPPIVVRPKSQTQTPSQEARSPQGGRVVAANRDNNFVVVDLGEDSGIKLGDMLQVYRSGEAIGTLEVIQVRKPISACDIKKESTPIRIGDTVR